MSYILDALRRADAERARGAVPGLHDQNAAADGEPSARNYTPLIWAAAAAGALVVAGVVLLWAPWRISQAPGGPPSGPAALGAPPQLAPQGRDNLPVVAQGETPPAQPGGLAPAALPVEPPMGRGPAGNSPPGPYPPPQGAAPTVVNGVPPLDARGPATGAAAPVVPTEHYGPPLASPASAAAPARAATVPNINDLPATVRSQLPRLAVGGAIYSEAASARMVILNGQVWHEGEKPAADTVLEQIRLKSAVLNFRGQRYEISY